MLNNSEVASILSRFPKFEDTWLGLSYAPHMPKHMVKETREVIAIARKFNEDVANPLALSSTVSPTKIRITCPGN